MKKLYQIPQCSTHAPLTHRDSFFSLYTKNNTPFYSLQLYGAAFILIYIYINACSFFFL
ncbi:hypothetical protein BDA99DRAFT_501874 [Phascolomyces articulosus]|uniref:Uncharacterized protein n=1 Tax=Phascolomyces articulosus TaxID=60185 RepID=A0AAD5K5G6_9FUNG|nr:hypothetical protein BDA99DRAFT_501874 [Phascolomyces articulosus]